MTCDQVIVKGTPRLSEETSDIGIPDLIHRFYHLKCAAAVHPEVVAAALANVDHGVVFDRAEIEAKIAPAVERAVELRKQKYLAQQAEREAKTAAIIVATDDTTNELLAQLDGNPEDVGTLAVVADQLQARGDMRGELIALQLATPRAIVLDGDDDEETDASDTSDAERRARRCGELMEKLSVPLDPGDKTVWGVGFIRRLELLGKTGTRLATLVPIWKHPSLRFLSELHLTFASNQDAGFITRLHELVPRTLRRLELGDARMHALAGVAALIAGLPRLEALVLTGKAYASRAEKLAHPALLHLALGGPVAGTLPFISPKALPQVASIAIRQSEDRLAMIAMSLGANGWFKRPLQLAWRSPDPITETDVEELAAAVGKKRLARLDLTGTKVSLELREALAKLAIELVAPDLAIADDQTIYIEHTAKPEWGRGKLVSKKDGKVEVDFGRKVGKKVFKADAPFLKLIA